MLELKDIKIQVGERNLFHLSGSLKIGAGVYALVGRNGAGKSTLLRTISGLHQNFKGEIFFQDQNIREWEGRERAQKIAVVFPKSEVFGRHTVKDILLLGRLPYQGLLAVPTSTDFQVMDRVASELGLTQWLHREFNSLSDGERQLVMIGRALVQDTPVILMDEPAAFLDMVNRFELGQLLKKVAEKTGKLILCSTHQVERIESDFHGILLIAQNELKFVEDPPQFLPVIRKTFNIL